MIRTVTIATVCGALALAGPALAADAAKATITSVQGAVAVSQNGKFADAKPGVLRTGDRIVAKTGEARVSYADGCVVTLKAGSMATIGAASPCAGQGLVTTGGSSAQIGELSPFGLVAGGLAVGGLVWGLISLTDDNDDVVISP